MKQAELTGEPQKERRPYVTADCDNLQDAERWRRQVVKEISKKVSQIQNPGLGEYQIRDLNDEINKLMREKTAWEKRIIDLGGPNYLKLAPRMITKDGKEVPGARGYKYFGAAKDLPGVRELLQAQAPEPPKRTRFDLYRHVDADYYGYRDDEDGILVELEAQQEKKAIEEKLANWVHQKRKLQEEDEVEGKASKLAKMYAIEAEEFSDDETEKLIKQTQERAAAAQEGKKENIFKAHVPVPSQEEIQKYLLERKRQMLLEKYVSDDLNAEEKETKELTGRS